MFLILLHCFFVVWNTSIVDLENRDLNILNGIRLPSAPKSILYVIQVLLWLMLDSNLVNMTDFILSSLMYFTLTAWKLLSCPSCFTVWSLSFWLILWTALLTCWFSCYWCVDLHTTFKWLGFPHSLHFLPYAWHHFLCALSHNTCNFPLFCVLGASLSHFYILCFTASNSGWLAVFLCTLFLYSMYLIGTCSHMTSSVSSNVATSLTIPSVMPSSLNPPMNCSVSILSYSLYSHSAALVHVYPSIPGQNHWFFCVIYSHAAIIWSCYVMVWIYCSRLRKAFCSSAFLLHMDECFMSCRPCWPNHFLITWTFSS